MTSKTYDVSADGMVTIETSSGDIYVQATDSPVVTVAKKADRVNVSGGANELMIRSSSKSVHVSVPLQCALRMRTASGDVHVEGTRGAVDAKTMSGDVKLDSTAGALHLATVSGDVRLSDVSATKLQVETVSGSCSAEMALDDEGVYTFHTISGDVVLELPPDQACTVDLSTWSGDLRSKLPHEIVTKEWRHKVAEVNGGGVPVDVSSTSGSVRLKIGDAQPASPRAAAEHIAEPQTESMTESVADPFDLDEPVFEAEAPKSETKPLSDQPFVPQYDPDTAEELSEAQQRMQILKLIEQGEITVTEGLERLNALGQ